MNNYYDNKIYFVYRHVAPNGKSYIGITSKTNPEDRWGFGGKGYSNNKHFWSAIQKYGWDNFKHIIVAHGLDVERACNLEAYLIVKYDSMNNGYNQTSGGIYPTEVTDDIRNTISSKVIEHRNSLPEGAWAAKFKGHKVSETTKIKISSKNKGRKCSEDEIARRVHTFKMNLTPEIRHKLGHMRGKHLSEDTKHKLRDKHIGRRVSESTKDLIRNKAIQRYSDNTYVWVHKNDKEFIITEDKISDYVNQGYLVGRANIKNIYVYKDDKSIKISESELSEYLAKGYQKGFNPTRYNNVARSRQLFEYCYNGVTFTSEQKLAEYLRSHGYPKIVQGTVHSICQGKVFKSYPKLNALIQRRKINENI